MSTSNQKTPLSQNQTFRYGRHTYAYTLIQQDRTTLSLTVEPCMDIVLKVPFAAQSERIEDFLQRKWPWLNDQLTFFEKYKKKVYQKEYVSGESFYYLGRQYKLIVEQGNENVVSLAKNRLTLSTKEHTQNGKYNKKILDSWYKERQTVLFQERYLEVMKRFTYPTFPELHIRIMPKRWGSFKGDQIVLNPLLIQAPKTAIDYVITHELCHIKYQHHDNKFYTLLETKFPNWQKTKEKLELLI
jgi:predicted metal-dependent hydrolase